VVAYLKLFSTHTAIFCAPQLEPAQRLCWARDVVSLVASLAVRKRRSLPASGSCLSASCRAAERPCERQRFRRNFPGRTLSESWSVASSLAFRPPESERREPRRASESRPDRVRHTGAATTQFIAAIFEFLEGLLFRPGETHSYCFLSSWNVLKIHSLFLLFWFSADFHPHF
jgi:hypothetical protein